MKQILVADHAHGRLACHLAQELGVQLVYPQATYFTDSELRVMIDAEFEGSHAIILHSTSHPANDNLMWLFLTIYALKQRNIKKISALIPYFSYSRQLANPDGTRGAAYPIVEMVERAGVDRIAMVELHDPELVDLFSIPAKNILLHQFMAKQIQAIYKDTDYALVAPDEGALARVKALAALLKKPIISFQKHRSEADKVEIIGFEGMVAQNQMIIIDDIIDTGTTVEKVAKELQNAYASCVIDVFGIHAMLSDAAASRLQKSVINSIWVTNTIPLSEHQLFEKLKVIDVSSELVKPLHEML